MPTSWAFLKAKRFLMFLFPLVYILSFLFGIRLLLAKNINGLLLFIIAGLPIYIHALSISFLYGMTKYITFLQSFKELIVLMAFGMVVLSIKKKPSFHLIDKLIFIFFCVSVLYLILPIGTYGFYNRLLAFKALSFFPIIYFTGRFCDFSTIHIKQLFSAISVVIIIAAVVVLIEVIEYEHLHSHTGFMDFLDYYFNGQQSGNYGLIWTFETASGIKRFGSIFGSPLELSSSAVLGIAAILALSTTKKMNFYPDTFGIISFLATVACIIFAVSRASFVNYLILLYAYSWLIRNKRMVSYFHYLVIGIFLYLIFFINKDLLGFIIDTLQFKNASSIGHLIEWINGINAMFTHPFGMGLGASGRVSMESDSQIGGENQLVIIGVQVGIGMVALYFCIYWQLIKAGIQSLKTATNKAKPLIVCVVLLKIGLIIPLFTSYIDTFIFITYISYFLCGLMINMIMANNYQSSKNTTYSVNAENKNELT